MMAVRARMATILTIDGKRRRRQEASRVRHRRGSMRVKAAKHDTASVADLVPVLVKVHVMRVRGVENAMMMRLIGPMLLVL